MKVFYHFHDVEFVPLEGQTPFDVLVEELDSAVVDLEMDLFWMIKAGKEPVELLRAHPGRFTMFHIKGTGATRSHAPLRSAEALSISGGSCQKCCGSEEVISSSSRKMAWRIRSRV